MGYNSKKITSSGRLSLYAFISDFVKIKADHTTQKSINGSQPDGLNWFTLNLLR